MIREWERWEFFEFRTTEYHFVPFLKNNPKAGRPNWPLHLRWAFLPPIGRGTTKYPKSRPFGGLETSRSARLWSLIASARSIRRSASKVLPFVPSASPGSGAQHNGGVIRFVWLEVGNGIIAAFFGIAMIVGTAATRIRFAELFRKSRRFRKSSRILYSGGNVARAFGAITSPLAPNFAKG
jgi:hypothetical protein